MADRRLFAKTVVNSDPFLEMPLSTQALYFHIGMECDDEGFLNAPKKIIRMIGASEDDLKVLIAKRFIIPFESGVIVVKHWNINNSIRADRKKATVYQAEREQLILQENGRYSLLSTNWQPTGNQVATKWQPSVNQVTTNCQPTVNQLTAQSNLIKDKIIQDNINQSNLYQSICDILSEEEWDKLDEKYDNILGLIDLIDGRLKIANPSNPFREIKSPYAYIISVAQKEKWRSR